MVEVRDNGPGIDPSVMPNIWELYVTGKDGGSGIGLWLSQQIAQTHGGKIEADSHGGVGALFRLSLPIKS
jgi:signal transduction histidine kinase